MDVIVLPERIIGKLGNKTHVGNQIGSKSLRQDRLCLASPKFAAVLIVGYEDPQDKQSSSLQTGTMVETLYKFHHHQKKDCQNSFKKEFNKLRNHSVLGKTMEHRKRVNIELVQEKKIDKVNCQTGIQIVQKFQRRSCSK